jgi:PncC family amidohydrolase
LEKPLEVLVGEMLRSRNLKLVVAESCTGGLIGHRLTNIPGSSDYYLGSITAYAYEAKRALLGVHAKTLEKFGAVSRQTVLEMALGVRKSLAGEFPLNQLVGISVSGIAGPGGATPDKPVGLIWVGMSAAAGDWAWKLQWHGNRIENKELTAQEALQLLYEFLEGNPRPETLP